jgi:hypothetical protein
MVRLTPSQLTSVSVIHPLLYVTDGPLDEEQLSELVPLALEGDEYARNELVVGHLSMLSHTVGRYLYHWPLTRRFLDEMVSAGVFGMVHALQILNEESLEGKTIGTYLLQHIYKHIETEVCALRGIAPAPIRTNQRRVKEGLDPIFGDVVGDTASSKLTDGYSYIESGFEEIDVLEALNLLRDEFELLDLIFEPENWGKTNRELSDLTGVPRRTVHWYRTELLRRYQELTDK